MDAWMKTLRQAVRCHQSGDLEGAEQGYREVLEREPNQALALHSLGLIAYGRGEHEDAEEFVQQAIGADPQSAIQYNTLGVIYEAQERMDQAIGAYRQAIQRNREYAEAYKNLATAYRLQGQLNDALQNYQQAARTAPEAVHILAEYADTLRQAGRLDDAIAQYHAALRAAPGLAELHNNLALCLKDQHRLDEATEALSRALEQDPDNALYLSNLAAIQQEQGRLDLALATCQRLMRLHPDQAASVFNFACVLRDLGRLDEAIHNNRRAIEIDPDMAEAHWNLAVCYLLAGRYAEGWEQFGWRRRVGYAGGYPHDHLQPAWDGAPFEGQRLFVHCEQGLGDAIQFARFLPRVKARGGTIILGAWPSLVPLFRDLPGVDEVVPIDWHTVPEVEADIVCSLLDIPARLLLTGEDLGLETPLFSLDPARVAQWAERIPGRGRRVGLVWSGSPRHVNDRARSCRLTQFAPLFEVPGIQWVSLQKDLPDPAERQLLVEREIRDLGPDLGDLADTGAAIAHLDLVISVDTAVLHLAASLGKPTWGLIPHNPDWRWMRERADSPWYPSLRLFRQTEPGDWPGVVDHVAAALRETS